MRKREEERWRRERGEREREKKGVRRKKEKGTSNNNSYRVGTTSKEKEGRKEERNKICVCLMKTVRERGTKG